MANKIELKRTIIYGIISFAIISAVFIFANYMEYSRYTEGFNIRLSQILKNINEDYPDTDISEIIKILNNDENFDEKDILREYGIDINQEAVIFQNNKYFKNFLITETVIFFCL